jgi:hypothetical protein
MAIEFFEQRAQRDAGILERRRHLNTEHSEAIERHEVPLEFLIAEGV